MPSKTNIPVPAWFMRTKSPRLEAQTIDLLRPCRHPSNSKPRNKRLDSSANSTEGLCPKTNLAHLGIEFCLNTCSQLDEYLLGNVESMLT